MVGRGGTWASTLKSLSVEGDLEKCQSVISVNGTPTYSCCPVPHTLSTAISDGPDQPKMSPVAVIIASGNLLTSRHRLMSAEASSLRPGTEYALARPSPNKPTNA